MYSLPKWGLEDKINDSDKLANSICKLAFALDNRAIITLNGEPFSINRFVIDADTNQIIIYPSIRHNISNLEKFIIHMIEKGLIKIDITNISEDEWSKFDWVNNK